MTTLQIDCVKYTQLAVRDYLIAANLAHRQFDTRIYLYDTSDFFIEATSVHLFGYTFRRVKRRGQLYLLLCPALITSVFTAERFIDLLRSTNLNPLTDHIGVYLQIT